MVRKDIQKINVLVKNKMEARMDETPGCWITFVCIVPIVGQLSTDVSPRTPRMKSKLSQ